MEISRPVVCVEFFLTHFFGLFASGSVCAYKFIRVMSMSMCTHTCVCMHVCLCMCVCACVCHCMCVFTHTHAHTHTYNTGNPTFALKYNVAASGAVSKFEIEPNSMTFEDFVCGFTDDTPQAYIRSYFCFCFHFTRRPCCGFTDDTPQAYIRSYFCFCLLFLLLCIK